VDPTCIKTSDTFGEDLEDIVKELTKGTEASIAKAITLSIYVMTRTLPHMLSDCKDTEDKIKEILDTLKQYKTYAELAQHISQDMIANSVDIYADAKGALIQYAEGKYEGFGKDLGEMMRLVLIGTKSQERGEVYL